MTGQLWDVEIYYEAVKRFYVPHNTALMMGKLIDRK